MSGAIPDRAWRAAWLAIAGFAILWAAKWPTFPLMLDSSYHLLIARQILDAGGPIAYEWWEAAPLGRPHLYPPGLHLALAWLGQVTGDLVTAIRMLSVLLPVGLLATLLLTARRLAGSRFASLTILIALMPYVFQLQTAITLAGTLGLIELLWLMVAVREGRAAAAGALLALLWYTHLTLPWVALIALACEAILRPGARRTLLGALPWLLAALPWGWHLWQHRSAWLVVPRYENQFVELYPAVAALAAVGAWTAWRHRQAYSWVVGIAAGCLLLAPNHAYRWLNGEGMVALILLAAAGASFVIERAGARGVWTGALIAAALVLSPTVAHRAQRWVWLWPDSAPWHLLAGLGERKTADAGYVTAPVRELLGWVRERTQPGEILWSNAPHVVGLLGALAGRATSSLMLDEVRPSEPFDPVQAAHVLLWLKLPPAPGEAADAGLPAQGLERVAETDFAVVWRATGARPVSHLPARALPLRVAFALAVALIACAAWELAGTRQAGEITV